MKNFYIYSDVLVNLYNADYVFNNKFDIYSLLKSEQYNNKLARSIEKLKGKILYKN